MMRFIFLLLLLANMAVAAYLYQQANRPATDLPAETNRDAVKIALAVDPAKARREAGETRKLIESLTGAKCVKLSVRPADAARVQAALPALLPAERIASRSIEEFTRFAVALPAQRDRRSADTLFASLRKTNVKDMSVLADHSISLGVFSTEEAARRVVADLEARAGALVKGIAISPRNPQPRETQFTLRDIDPMILAKLAAMYRDLEGATLAAAECIDTASAGPPAPAEAPR